MKADERLFPALHERTACRAHRDEGVRLGPTGTTSSLGIVLKCDGQMCSRLEAAIDDFSAQNAFPEEERNALQRCLHDILGTIVVNHGRGGTDKHDVDIQMLYQRIRRVLTIRIVDDGKMFRSSGESTPPAPDSRLPCQSLDDPGLRSVRAYADHSSYFRQGRFNHLILSRVVP